MARVIKREVEITLCEGCGKDVDYPHGCIRCGKVYCWECVKQFGVEYQHSVYSSGSGDGRYCIPCDTYLMNHPQPLHSAYLCIANLRAKHRRMYEDFANEATLAEGQLKSLQEKSRG